MIWYDNWTELNAVRKGIIPWSFPPRRVWAFPTDIHLCEHRKDWSSSFPWDIASLNLNLIVHVVQSSWFFSALWCWCPLLVSQEYNWNRVPSGLLNRNSIQVASSSVTDAPERRLYLLLFTSTVYGFSVRSTHTLLSTSLSPVFE